MLIDEDATVAVKCRTAIQALFLYFNLCPSVKCPIKIIFIGHLTLGHKLK
jgi:hypothetical protein